MAYQKQEWIDRVIDPVQIDLETGKPKVVQEGTRFTSTRANHFEQGIADAHNLIESLVKEWGGNFVAAPGGTAGLQFSASGLTANWTAGVAYVNGRRFEVAAGSLPLNATQGQWVYVDVDGVVKKTTSQAMADAFLPLWYFATDASQAITSTDRRNVLNLDSMTIDPTISPTSNTGRMRNLLSGLANMVKKITGKTNWWDTPRTTLENAVKRDGDVLTGGLEMTGLKLKSSLPAITLEDVDITADVSLRIAASETSGGKLVIQEVKKDGTWVRDLFVFDRNGNILANNQGRTFYHDQLSNVIQPWQLKDSGLFGNILAFTPASQITYTAGTMLYGSVCNPYNYPYSRSANTWQIPKAVALPANFVVDLGRFVDGIEFFSFATSWVKDTGHVPRSFTIDISPDKVSWTRVVTWEYATKGNYLPNSPIFLDSGSAPLGMVGGRYIRFTVTEASNYYINNNTVAIKCAISCFSAHGIQGGQGHFERVWHDANGGNRPYAFAKMVADQVLTYNTYTKIPWKAPVRDHLSSMDAANGRFIVPQAGVYTITGNLTTGTLYSGQLLAANLYVNGWRYANIGFTGMPVTQDASVQFSVTVWLEMNDSIDIYAYLTGSNSNAISISKDFSYLTVTRVA